MKKPTYKIEIYRGRDKLTYWRARHRNGRIVADGGEGYSERRGAIRGFKRLAAALAIADFEVPR